MAKYTSQQAQTAYDEAIKNGYSFNAKDKELINTNPDSFMKIYGYKTDWINASKIGDKTAMNNANTMAEAERKQSGYYSGNDGSQVNLIEGPSSFNSNTFSSQYDDATQTALNNYLNRGTYQSQYTDTLNNIANNITNQQQYSYNPDNDPAYQAAYRQMIREANRAQQDTLGQYATMTGGMPSTAAVSAAQQAGDNYRATMNDNLLNYMNADYQKYTDNRADMYNQLSAIMQLDDSAYQKWVDQVGLDQDTIELLNGLRSQERSEYDTDRNFAYGKYTDQLSYDADKANTDLSKLETLMAYYQTMYEQTGDSSWLTKQAELENSLK